MKSLTRNQAENIWHHMAEEPYVSAIIKHESIPDIDGRVIFRRFAPFSDMGDCGDKPATPKKKINVKADQEKRRREVANFLREVAHGIQYGK